MAFTLACFLAHLQCIFLFILSSAALPHNESPRHLATRQDASSSATRQISRSEIIAEGYEFIGPQSYFAISAECKLDTRDIDTSKYKNRFEYYKRAIEDATQIAKAAEKWPQFGTDASTLYMYKDLDSDENKDYATNITKNIKRAADWGKDEWGWDPYIALTCNDPYACCNNPVDNRRVACYVNHTVSFWQTQSKISCCAPFFTIADNQEKFEYGKSKNISNVGLDWMRTSGSFLIHEMMHTVQITQEGPHIVDKEFEGEAKKRIYGPKLCAKAARSLEKEFSVFNADSYAEFMLAMYWKDLFQGHLFMPETHGIPDIAEAPPEIDRTTRDLELISDSDSNYIDFSAQAPQPSLRCASEQSDRSPTSQPWAAAQINDYCTHITDQGWVVNSTLGRYGPKGYAAGDVAPASEDDLWISVSHDPVCDPNTGYKVELGPCKAYLSMALNGCNTESVAQKYGGQVQANCALWSITTRPGHDSTPPGGLPATPQEFPDG